MSQDKVLHLTVSALLCLGFRFVGLPKPLAASVALSIGAVRELSQHQGKEGWRDMGANVLGVGVAIAWR